MKARPRRLWRLLGIGVLPAMALVSHAQDALTPAQALDYHRIADLHFSPDATQLAYLVLSYSDDYAPHLSVMDLRTQASRELTPPGKSDRLPQWAPGGGTPWRFSPPAQASRRCIFWHRSRATRPL